MPRPKKNAKYMNLYLDMRTVTAIDDICQRTGIPKSRIVEQAVDEYVKRHALKDKDGSVSYLL